MAGLKTLGLVIVIFGVAAAKTLSSEQLQIQLLDKHQTLLLDLQNQYDVLMQRQLDTNELISEVVQANTNLQQRNEELEVRLQIVEDFLREFTLSDKSETNLPDDNGNREAELVANSRFDEIFEYKRSLTENTRQSFTDSSSESPREEDIPESDTTFYESAFLILNEDVEKLSARLNRLEKSHPNIIDNMQELKLRDEFRKQEDSYRRVRRNIFPVHSVFSAAMTSTTFGTNYQQTLVFDKIFTNLGGNLVESNSTFIAPVPGYYYFVFTLRSLDDKYIGVSLMKNNSAETSIYTDKSYRNVMESQSLVLQLATGDSVWLRLGPSEQYAVHSDDYSYCTFNGFILSGIAT